jgi:MYXO-CTERM domain-containing protein
MFKAPHRTAATLVVSSLCLPFAAVAANAVFTTESSFVAAAGATVIESFETTATGVRSLSPVTTPSFVVAPQAPSDAPIGVNGGPNTPNMGFGAAATDGVRYLTVYLPNAPQGALVFNLAAPTTAFGFNIIDYGEATGGLLSIATDFGAYSGGTQLASYSTGLANGNVQFFGIAQDQPFTRVVLTATGLDDAYALDKVYLSAPVPEPASAALALAGLAGLAGLRAHRRRKG